MSYRLQPLLLKQQMDRDDTYEDPWEDKENEWLPNLKTDILSTVFCYAIY